MTFGSLFSGCGGFDIGLERCGMTCLWQCEIDRQCQSVLARHWPNVVRYDDVRRMRAYLEAKNVSRTTTRIVRPDWVCGGFPCQDLSVAGKRAGLAGSRSGLWFTFRRIVALLRPGGVLIENVDGLRSSNGGRDLGVILRALGDMGYGWAYRVFDSQWFGLAQRRERVFIVGCLGSRTRAAEILFEPDCLPLHPAPSREKGERVAASLTRGTASGRGVNEPGRRREDDVNLAVLGGGSGSCGWCDDTDRATFVPDVAYACGTRDHKGPNSNVNQCTLVEAFTNRGISTDDIAETARAGSHGGIPMVAYSLRGEGFDASEDGTGRSTLLVFDERNITSKANRTRVEAGRECHTLHESPPTIAFQTRIASNGRGQPKEITDALTSCEGGMHAGSKPHIAGTFGVRRLTPRECSRLQGFPDEWNRWDADGNELSDSVRYRQMGNAVSVPVIQWIGSRIVEVSTT